MNLAHDLNTLTRVYVLVGGMRDEASECGNIPAVIALGEVRDMLNALMDENYADIDENGCNGFERLAEGQACQLAPEPPQTERVRQV